MNLKRIEYMCRFGGPKFVGLKIKDKLFKTNSAKSYPYHIFESADPKDYPRLLKIWYWMKTGENLDLENPRTFNEKIQWIKLYDSTPLKTRLADKYLVREWIREKIGEEYLVPLLGVWNCFDDIDFDSLPDQFALKCNHGSGWNMIVKDKSSFDRNEAKKKFDKWMKTNFAFYAGLELQYNDIRPKIIAEQYLEQIDQNLYDYKISVFHGEPKIIWVIGDRDLEHHKGKKAFFDLNWEVLELMDPSYGNFDVLPQKPVNLDEMLNIAKTLGENFTYVRVDLYNLSGKIVFGEMTFTPASGKGKWGGKCSIFSGFLD